MARPQRKSARKPAQDKASTKDVAEQEPVATDDPHKSILGGMNGGYRDPGTLESTEGGAKVFSIPFNDKSIICNQYSPEPVKKDEEKQKDLTKPSLIFTHGAGGGIANPATVSFAQGFAAVDPVLCFQGTMNLQSRVKSFKAVISDRQSGRALGGRSMGARAAVMAAEPGDEHEDTAALVLVSYPLVGGKNGDDVRDAILLDIPEAIDVLFVIGTADKMCDLEMLEEVRGKMKARSWLVTVQGADHGMSLKPKGAVEAVRRKTGEVSARWLQQRDDQKRHCTVQWDEDSQGATSTDWSGTGQHEQAKHASSKQDGNEVEPSGPPRKRRKK